MIVEFGIEKTGQVPNTVALGVLDILHPPEDILGGLLVFGLVGSGFLFDAEVVSPGFLHFRDTGIIGQPAAL
jgi:hypothetical protein